MKKVFDIIDIIIFAIFGAVIGMLLFMIYFPQRPITSYPAYLKTREELKECQVENELKDDRIEEQREEILDMIYDNHIIGL